MEEQLGREQIILLGEKKRELQLIGVTKDMKERKQ